MILRLPLPTSDLHTKCDLDATTCAIARARVVQTNGADRRLFSQLDSAVSDFRSRYGLNAFFDDFDDESGIGTDCKLSSDLHAEDRVRVFP